MIKNTLRYLTLALAFAGMSANAYADYNGQCNNDDACCDDSKFDLSAHVLIAKPCQDVTWLEVHDSTNHTATGQATFRSMKYDWDWGVAVAGSFKFCDSWSLGARYSYVQGDGDDSYDATALTAAGDELYLGHGIDIANNPPLDVAGGATSHGVWAGKLDTTMHTLDLLAQYDCCLCDSLKFKPFGGVRFIKLENDYSVKATTAAGAENNYTAANDGISSTYEMTAYGVVGGFDWEWSICGDFYLIGSISGAALSGDPEYTPTVTVNGAATSHYKVDRDCQPVFAFDSNVGVAWNTCLFGKGFDVQALYEGRYLSDVMNPTQATDNNASRTYGVHGLRVGVGLSF